MAIPLFFTPLSAYREQIAQALRHVRASGSHTLGHATAESIVDAGGVRRVEAVAPACRRRVAA